MALRGLTLFYLAFGPRACGRNRLGILVRRFFLYEPHLPANPPHPQKDQPGIFLLPRTSRFRLISRNGGMPPVPIRDPFPSFNPSLDDRQQGMGLRFTGGHQCLVGKGITGEELLQKVHPLVLDLSACHGNRAFCALPADLHCVEPVTASRCLSADLLQVGGDRPFGIRVVPETDQLRVPEVTPGLPPQNGLSQQRLPPEGDKPRPIQVSRMQTPETHYRMTTSLPFKISPNST